MSISVMIHARDTNVSPRLREYVEKKVGKLDRYWPSLNEVRVDLAEERNARSANDRNVAQLTLYARGTLLRAEERNEDIFAAVDAVIDKMHRQIERYKGKHRRGRGNGAGADTVAMDPDLMPMGDAALEDDHPGNVVRRKQFVLTAMTEAEALDQMQLLGHENFFVFYNADSSRVNVLYKRTTGDFGLIDPEIG